jgi:hypothetical protein
MNHLDEGTIHAWLDGALDAAQSREIEAHVAGCAACSAAVAEARGLIAGASRILGALDDVPGGVIPRGGSAAPGAQIPGVTPIAPASHGRAPRRWRITRWASGIAAVLVAAIVLSTANKATRSMEFSQSQQAVITDTSVIGASSLAASPAADEAATTRGPVGERREAALSAPPAAPPAPEIGGGAAAGKAAVVTQTRSAAANQTKQAAPPATQPSAERAITPSVADAVTPRTAPAAQQDSTRIRVARAARSDSTLALESVAVSVSRGEVPPAADVDRFAGCYRLAAPQDVRVGVATGVVGDAPASRRRAAAPSAAAPPAAAGSRTSEFRGTGLPAVVRLDTTRGQLGYVVRLTSDSAVGSWRVVGDSVRVDLDARGVLMLSPAHKVSCP